MVFALRLVHPQLLVSVASDRTLAAHDSQTLRTKWTLPCIGGHVAALAVAPADPALLALGCGDNLVRLWHTQAPGSLHLEPHWKGIQARVRAVRNSLLFVGDGIAGRGRWLGLTHPCA